MKLPNTLKAFLSIAYREVNRPVTNPNPVLEVGIFDNVTESIKQIDFLNGFKTTTPTLSPDEVEIGTLDTGKGALSFPDTKDYWMGNPI
jgi:hypothetical protein